MIIDSDTNTNAPFFAFLMSLCCVVVILAGGLQSRKMTHFLADEIVHAAFRKIRVPFRLGFIFFFIVAKSIALLFIPIHWIFCTAHYQI